MTVYYGTKYALTNGIETHEGADVEEVGDGLLRVGPCTYLHREGKEWHRTRAAAIVRAEAMRQARIASLEKSIIALQRARFS